MPLNNLPIESIINSVIKINDLSNIIFSYYYLSPLEIDNEIVIKFQSKMERRTRKILRREIRDSEYTLKIPKNSFTVSSNLHISHENEIYLNLCVKSLNEMRVNITHLCIGRRNGNVNYETLPHFEMHSSSSDSDEEIIYIKNYIGNIGNKKLKFGKIFIDDFKEYMHNYMYEFYNNSSSDSDDSDDSA
jgi:hypothetical protein